MCLVVGLKIPDVFGVLSEDAKKSIEKAFGDFEQLIQKERPIFFPHYTTHGRQHINGVLKIAAWLLTDHAKKFVTSRDIEWLCYATVLHDSAMHLTPSHFLDLIDGKLGFDVVPPFVKASWPILWEEFEQEAKHWTSQKRIDVFGKDIEIPTLPKRGEKWGMEERHYVGEFIRRYHHALAYNIAVNGLIKPAAMEIEDLQEGDRLRILGVEQWHDEGRKLIGLIAMSHMLPLRQAYDYLRVDKRHDQWRGIVHPTLLMALLRLADYFHFEERADEADTPSDIQSPVSKLETAINRDVYFIREDDTDRHALYIDLMPKNLDEFLRLDSLLKDMQAELDATWTVLGECYSHSKTALFATDGIWVRRVRSKLDNEAGLAAIEREYKYVPKRIGLQVSPGVLPLLTAPIYGDKPNFATREMLANAWDAIHRRDAWIAKGGKPQGEFYDQATEVRFQAFEDEEGNPYLTCTDRGIGMTLETVRDYFLTAGHSFRDSTEGQSLDRESKGGSIVGRFGVGSLAYFLLGPEVEVTTRHVSMDHGYRFTFHMDGKAITFTPVECPIGTHISVRLKHWDAYKLSNVSSLDFMKQIFCAETLLPLRHTWPGDPNPTLAFEFFGHGVPVFGVSDPKVLDISSEWKPTCQIGESSFNIKVQLSGIPGLYVNNILIPIHLYSAGWPSVRVMVDDPMAQLKLTLDRLKFIGSIYENQLKGFVKIILCDWFIRNWLASDCIEAFIELTGKENIHSPVFCNILTDGQLSLLRNIDNLSERVIARDSDPRLEYTSFSYYLVKGLLYGHNRLTFAKSVFQDKVSLLPVYKKSSEMILSNYPTGSSFRVPGPISLHCQVGKNKLTENEEADLAEILSQYGNTILNIMSSFECNLLAIINTGTDGLHELHALYHEHNCQPLPFRSGSHKKFLRWFNKWMKEDS